MVFFGGSDVVVPDSLRRGRDDRRRDRAAASARDQRVRAREESAERDVRPRAAAQLRGPGEESEIARDEEKKRDRGEERSEEEAEGVKKSKLALHELEEQLEAIKQKIVIAVAPAVKKFADVTAEVTQWLQTHLSPALTGGITKFAAFGGAALALSFVAVKVITDGGSKPCIISFIVWCDSNVTDYNITD